MKEGDIKHIKVMIDAPRSARRQCDEGIWNFKI
jgi:hypothetical protein